MLKKSLAALAVVGGLTVPGVAHAVPMASTATNVQLAWVDGKVRITWTEPADIPNQIAMEATGQQVKPLGDTTASGPNELVVPASALDPTNNPAAQARIIVTDPSTAQVRSAPFDRYIRGATPLAPGMNLGALNWAFEPDPATDTTPNDPLDTNLPVRFVPKLTLTKAGTTNGCQQVVLPATTTPYGVVPRQAGPYNVDLMNVSEWGESKLASVRVRTSSTTFSTPASGIYGAKLTMTGAISLRKLANPAGGDCGGAADTAALGGHQMVLHARNSATSPWYVVGVSKSDAQGKYTFVITNPGAREYRGVLSESAAAGVANFQSISASKVTRATPQVLQASFVQPIIQLGQQPNARVTVSPYGSQQVALQFKNSSGQWQGLFYRTLTNGTADSGPFAFNRRGDHVFRWWVGASTGGTGRPVDAAYTYPFTLIVE